MRTMKIECGGSIRNAIVEAFGAGFRMQWGNPFALQPEHVGQVVFDIEGGKPTNLMISDESVLSGYESEIRRVLGAVAPSIARVLR